MTKAQLAVLGREVEQMATVTSSSNEFREWADVYYFGMGEHFTRS